MSWRALGLGLVGLVGAAILAGCTATSVGVPSSSSSSSSSSASGGAPAAQGGASRCVGKPVEAYTVDDATSCFLQGSTWDSRNLECRGTSFTVSCARVEGFERPEEAKKIACLDMPGCGWTESDGTVTKPSGRCEGTKTPCSAFTEATCKSQVGCTVDTRSGCVAKNGSIYLENVGCENLQISNSVSFSVVRDACERAKGCTWVE
ncbi:MAG: hypothetical protein JST00_14175 [Deltaproteobacteria bacterium]|nr:hypothetical protein [Deltaproteobacteria bacterium]